MQDLDIVPDGTYSVWHGVATDYAAKWAYGYMVGVGNLLALEVERITQADLTVAEAFGDHLMGVWTDPETGVSYLDRVKHVAALSDALALARENGELAIWDLRERKTIYVPVGVPTFGEFFASERV